MKFNLNLLLVLLTLAGSAQAMNPEDRDQPEDWDRGWNMEEANMFPDLEEEAEEPLSPNTLQMMQEANEIFEREQQRQAARSEQREETQPQEAPSVPGYEHYRFGRPITFRQYYYGDEQLGIPRHKSLVDMEVQHGRMLQLSGLGITSLDGIQEVPNIGNLRSLLLSNNLFDVIPPIIGTTIPNLARLYMGQNRVVEIPAFITDMSHLEWLELDDNRIARLPLSLSKLTELQRLGLQGNMIHITMHTDVPDFGTMNHLHDLYIYNNPIPLGEQELRQKLNLKARGFYFKSQSQEQTEFEFLEAIRSGDEKIFHDRLHEILTKRLVPAEILLGAMFSVRINIATIRDADGNNILHAIVSALSKKMEEINNSLDLSDETKKQEAAFAELKYTKLFLMLFDRGIPQMQQMLFTPNADGLNVISAAIGAEGGLHGLLVKTLLDFAYAVEPRVTAQETARMLQRIQSSSASKVKEEKEGKETMAEKTAREQKALEDREWQQIREREQIRRLEDKRLRELREEEGL